MNGGRTEDRTEDRRSFGPLCQSRNVFCTRGGQLDPPVSDVTFFAPKEVSWGPLFPLSLPHYPARPCRPRAVFGLVPSIVFNFFNPSLTMILKMAKTSFDAKKYTKLVMWSNS